ncbi:Centromere/kinetochore Zw10-domain-containing protein [Zopfochytrium polystomum]|nr:Centromere/kinetochore Zw10-domain-containing protein [Zopfochytrium polystomum]
MAPAPNASPSQSSQQLASAAPLGAALADGAAPASSKKSSLSSLVGDDDLASFILRVASRKGSFDSADRFSTSTNDSATDESSDKLAVPLHIVERTIAVIDERLHEIETEVERMIDGRTDQLKDFIETAALLEADSAAVSGKLEELTRKVQDPESGELVVLQRRKEALELKLEEKRREKRRRLLAAKVARFEEVASALSQALKQGALMIAARSFQSLKIATSDIPHGEDGFSKADINARFDQLQNLMLSSMEDTLESFVSLDTAVDFVRLRLDPQVNVAGTGESTTFAEFFAVIELLALEDHLLVPLSRSLSRLALQPVISTAAFRIEEESENSLTLRRISAVDQNAPLSICESAFADLYKVFSFIEQVLFVSKSETSERFFSRLGAVTWPEIARGTIDYHITPSIPTTAAELDEYAENVLRLCKEFEDKLAAIGLLLPPNSSSVSPDVVTDYVNQERHLSAYCSSIEVHFTVQRRNTLLVRARELIASEAHDLVQIDRLSIAKLLLPLGEFSSFQDALSNMEQVLGATTTQHASKYEKQLRFLVNFPDAAFSISKCVMDLCLLLVEILVDSSNLSAFYGMTLFRTTRDILDLFAQLYPYCHRRTLSSLPQSCAVLYNSCMFIGHLLALLGPACRRRIRVPSEGAGSLEVTFIDMVPTFRDLGSSSLVHELTKHRAELSSMVEAAQGWDMPDAIRGNAVTKAANQIILHLNRLANLWRPPILPPGIYLRCIGDLLTTVFELIIGEVEALHDIAEEESHRLHLVLGSIGSLPSKFAEWLAVDSGGTGKGGGGWDKADGWDDDFGDGEPSADTAITRAKADDAAATTDVAWSSLVPSARKYQQLTDLVVLSFADIMQRLRAGDLDDFTNDELAGLVRALFADTPLRQKNLDEIRRRRR